MARMIPSHRIGDGRAQIVLPFEKGETEGISKAISIQGAIPPHKEWNR